MKIALNSRVSISTSRSIPPVGNTVIVGVPVLWPRGLGVVFQAASIRLVVDQTLLTGFRSTIGVAAIEGLVDDAGVMIVKNGLVGAGVGENALVCFGRCLFLDVGWEESFPGLILSLFQIPISRLTAHQRTSGIQELGRC